MKRIIFAIAALLALVSCTKEHNDMDSVGRSLDLSVTFQTKAGGSGSDVEPVINCMRVLIFYGDPAGSHTTGNMVFNNFYAFGFNAVKGTGKYTVNLANPIVLDQTDCRNFNVYVVLNEEGFQQQGPGYSTDPTDRTDLHKTLGDFAGTEAELKVMLAKPVIYDEVLKNVDEPAFLISGRKAVTFGEGELGEQKEVSIEVDSDSGTADFNRGRSMAQIIIKEITSEPTPKPDGTDGDDYSSSDVPLIFVKKVTLENVPNTIAWSDNEGSTDGTAGKKMAAVNVGEAKTHADGTYYDRIWYGSVSRTITNLLAQKVQYTDAKFYRTASAIDANKAKWSFSVKPYRTTDGTPGPGEAPYRYIYAHGKNIEPKADTDKAENAVMAIEKWDNTARGTLTDQLPNVFGAMQDDNNEMSENITYTSYEVTSVPEGGVTISPVSLSDDYWTVRLGDEFYVPENIQEDATYATCLKVTLAIADPQFRFRLNDKTEADKRVVTDVPSTTDKKEYEKIIGNYPLVDYKNLPSPSSLPGESSLTYTYYAGDSESGTEKAISAIDGNWIKSNGHVVWADDETHLLATSSFGDNYKDPDGLGPGQPGDHTAGYYVYIDGFSRRTVSAQAGKITVSQNLKGAYFSWNVPASDDSNTHVYEYTIPINNNLGKDGDYSIRRNTRYTVTLYVNGGTYESLKTKSGESCPFSITAKVTTEQVNCDEE